MVMRFKPQSWKMQRLSECCSSIALMRTPEDIPTGAIMR